MSAIKGDISPFHSIIDAIIFLKLLKKILMTIFSGGGFIQM